MKNLVCLVIASFASLCPAAIPENDSFATRIALFGTSISTTGSNVGATKEADEPDPEFAGGRSVWWTWTAPSNGSLTITTAGSSFDTMLSVFTGSALADLRLVAFNDTETNTSFVRCNVTAGTAYQIAVDGADNDFYPTNNNTGSIALQLTLGPTQPPPANDHFANRKALSGAHISNEQGSNVGATKELGEPFHADVLGEKTVWWTWTALASGAVTIRSRGISSRGGLLDTALGVYTGNSVSNLTFVAGNDEDDFGYESQVVCNVASNVTYQIAVDGFEGDEGSLRLDLDLNASLAVPSNDNFVNRLTLSGNSVTTTASNVGASFEPTEPMHMVTFGGKSLWWKWTASASGNVMLTTAGSAVDTILAVYTGTSLANLVFVAGNDDASPSESTSLAYFNCTAGTTYQIAVDGYDGSAGAITLQLLYDSLADPVPANDNFANRATITGTNTTVTGSNIGTTLEVGEPLHRGYYGGSSVWWTWTAPFPGIATVDTAGSQPDTLLAVYTGASLANLIEIGSDNNSAGDWASSVSFFTKSGVTYQIAVDGVDGDAGDLSLHVRLGQASYVLTLTTNPPNGGTVSASPAPDQAGNYAPGSVVTLTATAGDGNTFLNWSGNASSTNNPFVLALTSNKTVTAEFYVPPSTKVWSGSHPQNGNWTMPANWEGGLAPIGGDDLVFPPGAARLASNTNNFATNTTFRLLALGGADYVLRGNPIVLTNGLAGTNDSGTNTISLNLLLGTSQSFRAANATTRLEFTGGVNLSNRTLTVEAVGDIAMSGVISGTGGVTKTGDGTLILSGASSNSFTGATTVNQGTLVLSKSAGNAVSSSLIVGDGLGGTDADVLRLDGAQQIPGVAAVTVNSSGLLHLNNFGTAVATLAGLGHVEFGGTNAALTVGGSYASSAFSGLISGGGQLVKTGSGTFTLAGNNSYTGQTTVADGQLLVNGQQPDSAVIVNSLAVLGGTGRVANLSGVGTVSPGASPGVLSSGNVTFSSNTTLRVELSGASAGSGYDQLNVSGTVNLSGTLGVVLGFTPVANDTFTIINNDDSDSVIGTFNGLPQGGYLIATNGVFRINYAAGSGNDVVLTYVVPPKITCPANLTTNTAPGSCSRAVAFGASVTAGSPAPTLTYKLGTNVITSPYTFPTGTNVVTVTASNGVPTNATCSFLVIVKDNEPPAITCPANMTLAAAAGGCPVVANFSVQATDNCGVTNVMVSPASGSLFPPGTNLVTVVARDQSGNSNTCAFTVTVLPGPPTLTISSGNTQVVLSWPSNYGCYSLQYASDLVISNQWTAFPGPFATNFGTVFATNTLGPGSRYFRLAQ